MRSEEELNVLYAKFDHDVATKSRLKRVLLAVDQLVAVIFWNTSQDETVSSHIGRRIEKGTATWFDKKLCCLLRKIEHMHCKKSLGE